MGKEDAGMRPNLSVEGYCSPSTLQEKKREHPHKKIDCHTKPEARRKGEQSNKNLSTQPYGVQQRTEVKLINLIRIRATAFGGKLKPAAVVVAEH